MSDKLWGYDIGILSKLAAILSLASVLLWDYLDKDNFLNIVVQNGKNMIIGAEDVAETVI